MNRTIRVFIASSSENCKITEAVSEVMRQETRLDIKPASWHLGTFKPSESYIESLEGELGMAKFAVFGRNKGHPKK